LFIKIRRKEMEQVEIISWNTLDALKDSATKIVKIMGDIDTNEQMAIFCFIDEDFLELYYSGLESNYIRHFEDEEEFYKYIELRKNEFGEEDFDSIEYFEDDDDEFSEKDSGEDYTGYKIRDEDDEEDF
jgi:hypothetical protein